MATRRKSESHYQHRRKRVLGVVRFVFGTVIIVLGVGAIGWLSIASGFEWYVTAALCGAFVLAAVGDFTR